MIEGDQVAAKEQMRSATCELVRSAPGAFFAISTEDAKLWLPIFEPGLGVETLRAFRNVVNAYFDMAEEYTIPLDADAG